MYICCRRRTRRTTRNPSTDIDLEDIHSDNTRTINQPNGEEPHYYSRISEETTKVTSQNQNQSPQEANGRATRGAQGTKEKNMLNGSVEGKDDNRDTYGDDEEDFYSIQVPDDPSLIQEAARFDPKKPSKIELSPNPDQVLKPAYPRQVPKPGNAKKASKPAPQAPGVYDHVYAHFPEEGRMREPTGKNPKGESQDTLNVSKPEVNQMDQEGKETSNDGTYEDILDDTNPGQKKQNEVKSPQDSGGNTTDDDGTVLVDNDLYNS